MKRASLEFCITVFVGFIALALIAPSAEAMNQVDWSKIQSGKGRFTGLKAFDRQAALDKSTGLVWELMPGDTDDDGDVDADDQLEWSGADGAARYCSNLVLNGQMGFKLPSLHQLTSLLDLLSDDCAANEACLPDKHPFVGVVTTDYWSATTNGDDLANAWVVQLGDPNAGGEEARSLGDAAEMLDGEFYRDAADLAFTNIDSRDAYANEVGFVDGFPAGRGSAEGRAWLTHCYGMLGVGRANSSRSGNGAELYVVTGHAPRHLDRNVTLVGRVIDGIEHLTTLSRGAGLLGFYADASKHVPIQSIRFGSDLPQAERLAVELLRTDTATFEQLVEARRYRAEAWFVDPADHIGICNVPLPVRSLN